MLETEGVITPIKPLPKTNISDQLDPNKAIKLIQPKRFQKGGNLNTRFYNAIDPTDGYPSARSAAQYITRIASGASTPKRVEPVADAA
jgi:hypothetical protein